ncbi:MAG: CHASE2 domain-containing protein [Flavobacteriaceae bacterium]|nr:CHASE2 domain-containing protein [Flavobacteriaceae bacterium]
MLKEAFFSTLFCLTLTYLLSLIILNLSFLNPFKEAFKDFSFSDIFYAEKIQESKINSNIILVNIERRNRFEIGMLLESILEAEPKVIGVDAIFKDLKEEESDAYLAKFLQHEKVISAKNIDNDKIIKNHPFFKTKNDAFININFSGENVIRTFDAFYKQDSSFATKIALKFTDFSVEKLNNRKRIKYTGNYKSFFNIGFDELMLLNDKSFMKDKIVLLGYLGTPLGSNYDVEDKFFTPLNEKTAGKSLPDMFGVVIHANLINMFINNEFIYEVSNTTTTIVTLCFVFLFMILVVKLERKGEIYNRTLKWLILLLFTIILLYVHLLFLSIDIYVNVFFLTAITVVASNMFIFYVHFIKLLKKKISWKSYLD